MDGMETYYPSKKLCLLGGLGAVKKTGQEQVFFICRDIQIACSAQRNGPQQWRGCSEKETNYGRIPRSEGGEKRTLVEWGCGLWISRKNGKACWPSLWLKMAKQQLVENEAKKQAKFVVVSIWRRDFPAGKLLILGLPSFPLFVLALAVAQYVHWGGLAKWAAREQRWLKLVCGRKGQCGREQSKKLRNEWKQPTECLSAIPSSSHKLLRPRSLRFRLQHPFRGAALTP